MCKAEMEVSFPSAREAENAVRSLLQETEFKGRSSSGLSRRGAKLIVQVKAEDPVALRAALNSYLRLISILTGAAKTEAEVKE